MFEKTGVMKNPSELVRNSYPTALCYREPKERYWRLPPEYVVFVDNDIEHELGRGKTAVSAWRDAWEMVQYLMLWQLEQ